MDKNVHFRYQCDICEKDYSSSKNLKFHVKWVHDRDKSKRYTCEICSESFSRPGSLRLHITKIHNNTNIFKCKICDKELKSIYSLKDHISKHGKKRSFQCNVCMEQFEERVLLTKHQRTWGF